MLATLRSGGISSSMPTFKSGSAAIEIEQSEPATGAPFAALILLHGSGGASRYWLGHFAPILTRMGMAAFAPHYFDKTGTERATPEMILDRKHFPLWLAALRDAINYVAARPGVDARRIGVLGVSLGGYLAVALAAEEPRLRAVIEFSGGMPPGWEQQLSPATPPVLIVHGDRDEVVPVTEAYKLAGVLSQKQVRHEVKIYPDETHWFSAGVQPALLLTCADFLGRSLR